MTKNTLFLLVAVILVLIACKKDESIDFHKEYFGLETGRYVIYNVLEIKHDTDLSIQHDTLQYQLKTVWEGGYVDNEGRTASEFRRYKRDTPNDAWALTDIWTGIFDVNRAEMIEENQRKVKLVFAPTLSKEWDENGYNNLGEMNCYYSNVHADTTINGTLFDSTVFVEQENFNSLIDTTRRFEIYAKHIGLIYKFEKDNDYFFGDPEPQEGTELYYEYVEHGFQ